MNLDRKEKIKTRIAGAIVFLLIAVAALIALRYSVEGEENMPFKISKIVIGSMVVSDDNEKTQEEKAQGNIVQNNGVYFEIQKSLKAKNDEKIDSVEISNIKVVKAPKKGKIKIYMPNTMEHKSFTYADGYILDGNSLKYNGGEKSDTTILEINNQGGLIAIAFGNNNLGQYSLTEEELRIDGTILEQMGITDEDIKFTVNFDFIITIDGKKYKTNMDLELPTSDIIKKGKATAEITDTNKYVFKRVND